MSITLATGKPSLYQTPNNKNHEYVRVLVFYTQWRTIRYIHGKVIQISHIRKNLCLSFVHLGFQDIRLLELFVFWWVYPESWCHLPILFSSIYMAVHHSGLMHIYILNFFSLLLLLVCRYVDHGSFSSQCKSYLYLIFIRCLVWMGSTLCAVSLRWYVPIFSRPYKNMRNFLVLSMLYCARYIEPSATFWTSNTQRSSSRFYQV